MHFRRMCSYMVTTLYTVDNFRLREVCLSDIYARYNKTRKTIHVSVANVVYKECLERFIKLHMYNKRIRCHFTSKIKSKLGHVFFIEMSVYTSCLVNEINGKNCWLYLDDHSNCFISYNTLHCQVGTSLIILLENRLAEKAKIHTQLWHGHRSYSGLYRHRSLGFPNSHDVNCLIEKKTLYIYC